MDSYLELQSNIGASYLVEASLSTSNQHVAQQKTYLFMLEHKEHFLELAKKIFERYFIPLIHIHLNII